MRSARRGSLGGTFLVLAVGGGTFSLLQSLVSPVLPLLERELHTDQASVTWVFTAYLLSASVWTPIIGRIGDMVGKERVLVVALAILAAGSVLAALSPSIGWMIAARVIQGVGGGVIPLSFGIIRDEFPPSKVPSAIGVIAALLAVGGGLGLVLSGPIVNLLSYHWLFWIPAILVAGAAVATHRYMPRTTTRRPGRVSWTAAVLLSTWLVLLLLGVSRAPAWGWGSARTLVLFGAAVLVGLAWGLVEVRSKEPLIDMRMMRAPAIWTTNLVALLFGAGMYAVLAFLPVFVQTPGRAGYGFGVSVTESGLISLPMSVMMFVFGSLSGVLSLRFGAKAVLTAGMAISVVPFVILAFAHSHVWQITGATALLGVGFGLAYSAMSNIVVEAVPSHQTGVASGMNANIRTIGGSIGTAVAASIVTAGVAAGAFPEESGYTTTFVVLGAVLLFAAAAALLVPPDRPARVRAQEVQPANAVA